PKTSSARPSTLCSVLNVSDHHPQSLLGLKVYRWTESERLRERVRNSEHRVDGAQALARIHETRYFGLRYCPRVYQLLKGRVYMPSSPCWGWLRTAQNFRSIQSSLLFAPECCSPALVA